MQTVKGRPAVSAEVPGCLCARRGGFNLCPPPGYTQGGCLENHVGTKGTAIHLAADRAVAIEDIEGLGDQGKMDLATGAASQVVVSQCALLSRCDYACVFIVPGR